MLTPLLEGPNRHGLGRGINPPRRELAHFRNPAAGVSQDQGEGWHLRPLMSLRRADEVPPLLLGQAPVRRRM